MRHFGDMGAATHILIVDDDPRVRDMLQRYLQQQGFRVSAAESGAAMRARLAAEEPVDLVLLDLVMPDEDGLTLARHLREVSDVAIIMLTGRGDTIDRVVGLEMGADDYITKPFHLREVLARVNSVLRRSRRTAPAAGPELPPSDREQVLTFDGWRFDWARRTLHDAEGSPVELTKAEFDLLHAFLARPNRVLGRQQLMGLTKGRDWQAYDRSIDVQVGRLRRKIERDPSTPELIKSVRGVGYVFTARVAPEGPF